MSPRDARPDAPLLLLDAASLYYRAFHGVPDRRESPDAPPNNAVRGLLDMLATLVLTRRPAELVACWDEDWRPAFRVEAIPTYKTHRLAGGSDALEDTPPDLAPQVPVIVELLAALGIPRVGAVGYEADDVIGTLVALRAGSRPVEVVTGDRDLFQLIDDEQDVTVLYTAKGGVRRPEVITQSELEARYGVPTGEAYADLAVLRGDASDGLPGVRGIGERTGAALLRQYGSLAGLRAAVDGGDPTIKGARRRSLEEAASYLDVAPGVVRVARGCDVPAGPFPLPAAPADPARVAALVESHDLASPVERLLTALARA